ncbi:MAG: THUMP domain-containing class I SAM-dependent RNA methyltransferase [Saezia sp.]
MTTKHSTQTFQFFLPCAAGTEPFLSQEITSIAPRAHHTIQPGGVSVRGSWELCMQLNLQSRIAMRVLLQVAHASYLIEQDIYQLALKTKWEDWFSPNQTFKINATARRSPLHSLNFATLRVKDGIVDRFREQTNDRPDVETKEPDVQVQVHFDERMATFYIDTSGDPLFKRGWRQLQGDAPLKETLAAAMIAASGWNYQAGEPFLDPCCGSGTIAIEAAQIACGIPPGLYRRFAFEKLTLHVPSAWQQIKQKARDQIHAPTAPIFANDVSFRMVDFAKQNAQRASVAHAIEFHGSDALERKAPALKGMMVINPPYGERINPGGSLGRNDSSKTGYAPGSQTDATEDFFPKLASHWKQAFDGWTAWVLTPDMKLPQLMRLKESRRTPLWNGPIECRLMRFDIVAGSARRIPQNASPETD